MSSDTRLIERWLPIAALGEESVRERRSMTCASAQPTTFMSGGRVGRLLRHVPLHWVACCQQMPTERNSCICLESTVIR